MDRANLPALTLTTRGLSAATPVASPLKSPSLTATDYALEAVFVALLQAWHRSVNTAQVVRKSHPQMAFDFPDLKDIFSLTERRCLLRWACLVYSRVDFRTSTEPSVWQAAYAIIESHNLNKKPDDGRIRAGIRNAANVIDHFIERLPHGSDIPPHDDAALVAKLAQDFKAHSLKQVMTLVQHLGLPLPPWAHNTDNWTRSEIDIIERMVFVALHCNDLHKQQARDQIEKLLTVKMRGSHLTDVYARFTNFPVLHTGSGLALYANFPQALIPARGHLAYALSVLADSQGWNSSVHPQIHNDDTGKLHSYHPRILDCNHRYHTAAEADCASPQMSHTPKSPFRRSFEGMQRALSRKKRPEDAGSPSTRT